ncbi:MAG TPA: glycosyltransferase family 1 protein [Planctomycetes bacterium]|nr:glycosyltransferase family 1 protein [Planctomycetota bacterium]
MGADTLACMRVGFDASACSRPHSPGVRRVASRLLEALEGRGALEVVRLSPGPGDNLRRWRRKVLPRLATDLDLDGLHSFTSSFPWRARTKRVQTVHELPWKHGEPENATWRHKLWVELGSRRAHRVLCPSRHVARDLGEGPRVRVVPWGVAPIFRPEPRPGTIDEVLLKTYRLGSDPIVLCPGAVRRKKNLAAVLHGVRRLLDDGPRVELVVTGEATPDLRRDLALASKLGLASRISTLESVSDDDLAGLYRLASAVPLLSRSEGFCLPAAEALASGTPVLVPAGTAQAEVAGAGAILVDPDDADSVAVGLRRAIEGRERARFDLPRHAASYTWQHAAEEIERIWSELA